MLAERMPAVQSPRQLAVTVVHAEAYLARQRVVTHHRLLLLPSAAATKTP
jgi:hypothetical protein